MLNYGNFDVGNSRIRLFVEFCEFGMIWIGIVWTLEGAFYAILCKNGYRYCILLVFVRFFCLLTLSGAATVEFPGKNSKSITRCRFTESWNPGKPYHSKNSIHTFVSFYRFYRQKIFTQSVSCIYISRIFWAFSRITVSRDMKVLYGR